MIDRRYPDTPHASYRRCDCLLWAIAACLLLCLPVPSLARTDSLNVSPWHTIAAGLETAWFPGAEEAADSVLAVIRIDPDHWELRFHAISQSGDERGLSAVEWCRREGLTAAINGGMYDTDYRTHIGYFKTGEHVNSDRRNTYQSALAYGPHDSTAPAFRLVDLDETSLDSLLVSHAHVMQNLRLIKRPGENRWSPRQRRWVEAALAEDSLGRILFLFHREPVSMHAFNEHILSLPLGIVAAQHLEGGVQAQMYLHHETTDLSLSGGDAAGLRSGGDGGFSWPLPTVIGIAPKKTGNE